MAHLMPRQPAPALTVDLLDGGVWTLADQQPEHFTLIIFYRGYHCPMCKAQLRDLDRNLEGFAALGVDVIAISSNPRELAQQTVDDWKLANLTVGYGLSLDKAREWGLYISNAIKESEPDQFSEPGFFIINPDGSLYGSTVATMPFARTTAKQLLDALSFIISKGYPSRGEA